MAMRLASYAVVFELAAALVQLVPSVSTDVAGAGTVDVAAAALALAVWAVDATVHRRHVRRARWACWLAVLLTLRCVDLVRGQFVGDVFSSLPRHSDVLVGTVACACVALGEVHLDWARHLWRYAGVTTAAVCVAVVLELFRVGWS